MQANSDCQGHNGRDINRPLRASLYLIAFQKLHIWYEDSSRYFCGW